MFYLEHVNPAVEVSSYGLTMLKNISCFGVMNVRMLECLTFIISIFRKYDMDMNKMVELLLILSPSSNILTNTCIYPVI